MHAAEEQALRLAPASTYTSSDITKLWEEIDALRARSLFARVLLKESVDRFDQYTGPCPCPGVTCVESCAECRKTQGLVNRIHAALRGDA